MIKELLMQSKWRVFNISIAKAIGLHETLVLMEIADAEQAFDGEDFFLTYEHISENTTLSEKQIRRAVKNLKDLGIIQTQMKGVPAKQYFYIVNLDILKNDDSITDGMGRARPTKNGRSKPDKTDTPIPTKKGSTIYKEPIYKEPIDKKPINKRPELVLPFTSNEFIELWDVWKKYKQQQHRFKYKSKITEQAALNKLFKLSNGEEDLAKKIIMQSIDNGWKGFFAYKGEIKHDPLHNLLKETFISEYQKITGNEYLWTERDDKPISELIDKIRYAYKTSKRNPVENPTPEQMKKGLLYLIGRAANDSWMAANLEPRILNNKFNNLMNNNNGKNGISNVVAQVLNELNI